MIWFACGAQGSAGRGAHHRAGQASRDEAGARAPVSESAEYGSCAKAQPWKAADFDRNIYRTRHGSSQFKTPYYRYQCAFCQAVPPRDRAKFA
jgi:hypothetical protein